MERTNERGVAAGEIVKSWPHCEKCDWFGLMILVLREQMKKSFVIWKVLEQWNHGY